MLDHENPFRGLCSDTTFKYLFKCEETRKVLEDLIFKIANIDLSEYELMDNEINSGNQLKDFRLDIVLKKGNSIVSIEMNEQVTDYILNKNHTYLYRLAGNVYEKGRKYDNAYVTQINFNHCYSPKRKGRMSSGIKEFGLRDLEGEFTIDGIKDYEIYLLNYKNICYNKDNLLESYLSLFTAKSIEDLRKISSNNKEMTIIVDELERLNSDKYFGALYDNEIVQKKLQNSAWAEGALKKAQKIALALLEKGIDIQMISECTDLSVEEIENLKEMEEEVDE